MCTVTAPSSVTARWTLVCTDVDVKTQRGRMPKREAVAEGGLKPGEWAQNQGWKQDGRALGTKPLTVHIEGHDTLGHTVGIGGHAAVGTMVAGPGAHDGDDGAIGTDVDIVCGVGVGKGSSARPILPPWCCQQVASVPGP